MPDAADAPPVEPTDTAQDAAEAGIREIIDKRRDRGKDSRKAATVMHWSLVFTVLVGILFYVAAPLLEQVVNTRTAALRETATQLDTQLQEQNAARRALRDRNRPPLEFAAFPINTNPRLDDLLVGNLTAQDGSVLIHGSDGVLLRLSESGEAVTRIETGVTTTLRGDLQAQDGSVLIHGSDGVLLRLSESGETVTRIETGTAAFFSGGLVTEVGSFVVCSDRGDILQVGDALARRADGAFSDIDQILQGDSSSLGANEEPLQVRADRLLLDFLNGLPPHIQDISDIADARQELVAIMTRRAVLTDIQTRNTAELERWSSWPYAWLSRDQARETFAAFLTTCRGPNYEAPAPETAEPDPMTLACLQAWQAEQDAERETWWTTLATSVPPGILLLFLLATLGGLYRYNLRLAGFHHGRADVLELMLMRPEMFTPRDKEPLPLSQIADALAADKVEFGKGNTPTNQAVEMARALMAR